MKKIILSPTYMVLDGLSTMGDFSEGFSSFHKKNGVGIYTCNSKSEGGTFPLDINFSESFPFFLNLDVQSEYMDGLSYYSIFWGDSVDDFCSIKVTFRSQVSIYKSGKFIGSDSSYGLSNQDTNTINTNRGDVNNIKVLCENERIYILINDEPFFCGTLNQKPVQILGFQFSGKLVVKLSNFRIHTNVSQDLWNCINANEKFNKPIVKASEIIEETVSGIRENMTVNDKDDYTFDEYGLHDNHDGTFTSDGGERMDYADAQIYREQSDREDGIVSGDD